MTDGGVDVAAMGEVERRVSQLDRADEITATELEALRQALPTDPTTAEAVQKGLLHYPWDEVFEYVEGSERQDAYWRVKPLRRVPRSDREAAYRDVFSAAAAATEGTRGVVEHDGEPVPRSAAEVAEATEGVDADDLLDEHDGEGDPPESGLKAVARLRGLYGLTDTSDG